MTKALIVLWGCAGWSGTLLFACNKVRPRGYKTFSCSTELRMKFQLLIKTKILTNKEVSCFKSLRCCIYHANKC